jgi:hypothetical protein
MPERRSSLDLRCFADLSPQPRAARLEEPSHRLRGVAPKLHLWTHVAKYDEAGLYRLLLEVTLLDWAYQSLQRGCGKCSGRCAARHRQSVCVDAEKIQKAVAQEFAAKRKKQERKATAKKKVTA